MGEQAKPIDKIPKKAHEKVITWIEPHPKRGDEMLTASAGMFLIVHPRRLVRVPRLIRINCVWAVDGTIKVWESKKS